MEVLLVLAVLTLAGVTVVWCLNRTVQISRAAARAAAPPPPPDAVWQALAGEFRRPVTGPSSGSEPPG
ncbi:MAG: hypothetical protein C0501_30415 [Isosphaera sp.]|nr:hypothetical protein [Isosphaera sp.]